MRRRMYGRVVVELHRMDRPAVVDVGQEGEGSHQRQGTMGKTSEGEHDADDEASPMPGRASLPDIYVTVSPYTG